MARKRPRSRKKAEYKIQAAVESVWKLSKGEQTRHGADEYFKSEEGGTVVPQVQHHGGVLDADGKLVPVSFKLHDTEVDDDGEFQVVDKKNVVVEPVSENVSGKRRDAGAGEGLVAPGPQPRVPPPVFRATLKGEAFGSLDLPCLEVLRGEDCVMLVLDDGSCFGFSPKAGYDVLKLSWPDDELDVMYCGQTFTRDDPAERYMIFVVSESETEND